MIRRFRKSDAQACAKIINDCHKSMPELKGNALKFLLEKYVPEFVAVEFLKNYVLVFVEQGSIKGLGALLDGAELRWIYVDPVSQKKGIGKALLAKLEMEVKRRGLNKVHLKSYFGSKTFYEKFGYKYICKDITKYKNFIIESLVMEKNI